MKSVLEVVNIKIEPGNTHSPMLPGIASQCVCYKIFGVPENGLKIYQPLQNVRLHEIARDGGTGSHTAVSFSKKKDADNI